MRLNQKTAIVTGAGSGMGQAEAIGFAKEGAQVVVADVNLATAEATRDAIIAAGGKAIALAVAAQLLSRDWAASGADAALQSGTETGPAQPAGEMMQN